MLLGPEGSYPQRCPVSIFDCPSSDPKLGALGQADRQLAANLGRRRRVATDSACGVVGGVGQL